MSANKNNQKTFEWGGFPPIEECTNMGDTNGNKFNMELGVGKTSPNINKILEFSTSKQGVDIPVFHMMTLLKVLGILPPEMLNGKE